MAQSSKKESNTETYFLNLKLPEKSEIITETEDNSLSFSVKSKENCDKIKENIDITKSTRKIDTNKINTNTGFIKYKLFPIKKYCEIVLSYKTNTIKTIIKNEQKTETKLL